MIFKGKVAVVTGTSRGIGRAIVEEFVSLGANVACISKNADLLNRLQAELGASQDQLKTYSCDVSNPELVNTTIKQIVADFGKIDILVNNAGVKGQDKLAMQTSDSDWTTVLNTNLNGAFYISRAVYKYMVKNKCGRIINLSSILGTTGRAGQIAYTTSKAGLIGMTKTLAQELAARGVTCNAILPGYIDTDMNADLPETLKETLVSRIPVKRYGEVKEVAKLAAFLAGPDSAYITGQSFLIDGGLSLS
ncbi:MAG: SDR family oxidoreductase [Chlamydiae bacterium]|nr:SDR family oxidoreductase [Chlamydiota bacterium]